MDLPHGCRLLRLPRPQRLCPRWLEIDDAGFYGDEGVGSLFPRELAQGDVSTSARWVLAEFPPDVDPNSVVSALRALSESDQDLMWDVAFMRSGPKVLVFRGAVAKDFDLERLRVNRKAPVVAVFEEVEGESADAQALWHLFLLGAFSTLGPERVGVMQLIGLENARKPDQDDPEDGPIWGALSSFVWPNGNYALPVVTFV